MNERKNGKVERFRDCNTKHFEKIDAIYVMISTKLGTKHPWVNQICSNKWPHPFPRGDNYEIAKIY